MDWLKEHAFLAAWLSPTITLVGLIWKRGDTGHQIGWSKLVIYVALLSAIAAILTPGIPASAHDLMAWIAGSGMAFILFDAMRDAIHGK